MTAAAAAFRDKDSRPRAQNPLRDLIPGCKSKEQYHATRDIHFLRHSEVASFPSSPVLPLPRRIAVMIIHTKAVNDRELGNDATSECLKKWMSLVA